MNKHKQNHNVMHKKQFYEAPEAEMLMVRFEENIMSPQFSRTGTETMSIEEEEDF